MIAPISNQSAPVNPAVPAQVPAPMPDSAPPQSAPGSPAGVDPAQLGLGGGWTMQQYDHKIHSPYNEPESAHFQTNGNSAHFNLASGDAPFKRDTDTDPRVECRVKNDYGSGEHFFSADYQVSASPGNRSCVFQIHRGEGPGGATNMMLFVKDGVLTHYGKPIAEVGDQPFNLKVYHNADNGNIKVFVNDNLALDTKEKNPSDGNYWKFGLYGICGNAEAVVSNVQMFSRGGAPEELEGSEEPPEESDD